MAQVTLRLTLKQTSLVKETLETARDQYVHLSSNTEWDVIGASEYAQRVAELESVLKEFG